MADFMWNQDGAGAVARTVGDVLHIEHDGPEDEVWQCRLLDYEMDALSIAWLRWRADQSPAELERLLTALEGEATDA